MSSTTTPKRRPIRRDTVRRFDTAPVSFRMGSDDLERLDSLSDRLGRSRGSLLREAAELLGRVYVESSR